MGNLFDDLDRIEREESQGGGGYICKGRICFGMKAFIAGASNENSFFEFNPVDDNSRQQALEKCKKFIMDNGGTTRPTACACIIAYKDAVYNKDVSTWKDNRYWTIPMWTPAYREIMKPKMKETGIEATGDYFCHISFVPDPTGKKQTIKDQNTGEQKEIDSFVPYIRTIFANEAEAREAGGNSKSPDAVQGNLRDDISGDVPAGWTVQTWQQAISDIKQAKESGQSPAAIAEDYGVEVRFIVSAIKS